jgi:hypothetical protein
LQTSPLMQHGGENSFVVGDLLSEHSAAGPGQTLTAPATVAVALVS